MMPLGLRNEDLCVAIANVRKRRNSAISAGDASWLRMLSGSLMMRLEARPRQAPEGIDI